jgi:hypothetical protein
VPQPIRADSVLPAQREVVRLGTGQAELSLPIDAQSAVALVCVAEPDHPLLRTAAWRLPALAGLAVLRVHDARDVGDAVSLVRERGLGACWLAGWSFGADAALRHGDLAVTGAVALSPSLREVDATHLAAWAGGARQVVALVAELDDHLRPEEARMRFEAVPQVEVVVLDWARHDWEGETERVLDEVVRRVAPGVDLPLATEWDGPVASSGDVTVPRPRTAE